MFLPINFLGELMGMDVAWEEENIDEIVEYIKKNMTRSHIMRLLQIFTAGNITQAMKNILNTDPASTNNLIQSLNERDDCQQQASFWFHKGYTVPMAFLCEIELHRNQKGTEILLWDGGGAGMTFIYVSQFMNFSRNTEYTFNIP